MFENYLKVAFRNIYRNKVYSLINVAGLAIGMAACILILLWVQDELSFDKFHKNAEEIHLVGIHQTYASGDKRVPATPAPLADVLREQFPEIVNSVRYNRASVVIKNGEDSFNELVTLMGPQVFDIFTIPFVKGDPKKALSEPHSLVLSEESAKIFFGDEEAYGKTVTINDKFDFTVTGIVEDFPENSTFGMKILVPFNFGKEIGYDYSRWKANWYLTFVQLAKGVDYKDVSEKIRLVIQENTDAPTVNLYLVPLLDLHLRVPSWGLGSDIQYVRIFTIVAIFILLIACINFMNLSTARSAKRAKEVGMRKVIGADRGKLIFQFLSESLLLSFIALLFAVLVVELLLPVFNNLSDKKLMLDLYQNWVIWLGLLAITGFTGIVAGSYPALFLSGFKPISVLKGSFVGNKKTLIFRRVLVVSQFALSIILIISTFVIHSQLHYMQNKKLGLDKENVLYFSLSPKITQLYDSLKEELLQNNNIVSMTKGSDLPSNISSNTGGWDWEGRNPEDDVSFGVSATDYDYHQTFGLEIAEGRFFDENLTSDAEKGVVINEEAAKIMGMEVPVGKRLSLNGDDLEIIGVVKNFHYKSVHSKIEPIVVFISPSWYRYTFIRILPENMPQTIAYLKDQFLKFDPDFPFETHFVSESYENLYFSEQRLGIIFKYFAGLAIFISCLGLFGLASFIAEQRTKEIGIRKVMGASITSITFLLTKNFTKWVLLSNLIAWPVGYYATHKWLEGFAYKTAISGWVFLLAGTSALFIAILAVSFQSIKAAAANPVKALQYE